jgi:hypothetical protein
LKAVTKQLLHIRATIVDTLAIDMLTISAELVVQRLSALCVGVASLFTIQVVAADAA